MSLIFTLNRLKTIDSRIDAITQPGAKKVKTFLTTSTVKVLRDYTRWTKIGHNITANENPAPGFDEKFFRIICWTSSLLHYFDPQQE